MKRILTILAVVGALAFMSATSAHLKSPWSEYCQAEDECLQAQPCQGENQVAPEISASSAKKPTKFPKIPVEPTPCPKCEELPPSPTPQLCY